MLTLFDAKSSHFRVPYVTKNQLGLLHGEYELDTKFNVAN